MKRRLTTILIFILIAVLCFALVACNDSDSDYDNGDYDGSYYRPQPTPPPVPSYVTDKTQATAFISIDINPSIELTLNYDDVVLSAYGANDDGKVLLYGEDGIVGKSVDVAISKITALAINLGYLTKDNSTVQTSVTSISSDMDDLEETVHNHISAVAEGFDIDVSISAPNSYSLTRKFDELKENNPDNSQISNLSINQFRILSSASEATARPIEAMLSLDTDELIQAVSTNHRKAEQYETEEYKKEYSVASDIYEKALGEVMDGIYTSYYIIHHPFRAYYGLSYQGYKYTGRALKAIADSIDYLIELKEYPLEESQIEIVVKILGLENADELRNADGEVTVKSIEAYADKKFKETELSATLEEMKENLTASLKAIESTIQTKVDEITEQYAPQIEEIATTLEAIISELKEFETLLPAPVQSALRDFSELVDDLFEVVSDFRLTVADIRYLSDKASQKANSALSIIQNDLTPAELEDIAEIQQSARDGIGEAKEKFEEAIKNAGESAKAYIEEIKNQRKSAN